MHQICCWHSQQSAKLGQRGALYSLESELCKVSEAHSKAVAVKTGATSSRKGARESVVVQHVGGGQGCS